MPLLKGTWTWTATDGRTGSELPSGTAAKRARHQQQATKGRQVEKYHGRKQVRKMTHGDGDEKT